MPPDLAEILPDLHEEVRPRVRLGLIQAAPVRVGPASQPLIAAATEVCSRLVERHAGLAPAEIDALQPARELYRSFGIDPTRIRPSSEALLRRVLRGRPFPWILDAVDVANLCGLEFLLPIGLYDVDRIEGPVTLRAGRPGESYPGIRKDDVHLAGRPVLADARGAFGNPTSDSARTAVSESTRSLWMVVFAPASLDRDRLAGHVERARDYLSRYLAPPGETVVTAVRTLP
jgi:DNA/RNA-binding domain of Phe-tRNA-synthetase-like protein